MPPVDQSVDQADLQRLVRTLTSRPGMDECGRQPDAFTTGIEGAAQRDRSEQHAPTGNSFTTLIFACIDIPSPCGTSTQHYKAAQPQTPYLPRQHSDSRSYLIDR